MKYLILTLALPVMIVFFTSCATTHPNEKLLYGEWKPMKAEKYLTPEEEQQLKEMGKLPATGNKREKGEQGHGDAGAMTGGKPGGDPGLQGNPEDRLNRLIKAESAANMVVYSDKTAAKFYPGKTVKATWKLRGNGTVLIAKNVETKDQIRMDILEISDSEIVLIENLPFGGIKITYQKIK